MRPSQLALIFIVLLAGCQSDSISPAITPTATETPVKIATKGPKHGVESNISRIIQEIQVDAILTPDEEDIIRAFELETSEQWDAAADLYRSLAEGSVQPEQSSFYLRAGLMTYKAERYHDLEPFFDSLANNSILEEDQLYKQVILAGSYFGKGKIYQSLLGLPEIEDIVDYQFKALALNIRSLGILAIGKPMESARLRMQISQFLKSPMEIESNHDFIWDALNRISEKNIITTLKARQSDEVRGWLELNLIARRSNMVPAKIEPWMDQWYKLYGKHPAATEFAFNLLEESRRIFINPTRIALMLPFSGRLQKVSEAIQNGFMYGFYQDLSREAELEIIDASSDPVKFNLQYEQAIQNGADFIVGPIDKALINMLQDRNGLAVPTLTLNYADDENISGLNLYQFGLRPEDEAEQIADYALTQGRYHAVALVPDTDWGLRLLQAFKQRFEKLGGHVVGNETYPSRKNDYSNSIKRLLHLVSSNQRKSILQKVLKEPVEFDSRRRQDIDMIFIAANARQARLIKPQLKFHQAHNVPVYATSHISSSAGTADSDRDLNDILYVDIPWMLDQKISSDAVSISTLWPTQSKSFSRLFALGIDAYKIIPALRRLMINPAESLDANTGKLTVDKNGRVHRSLLIATYQKGLPLLIQTNQIVNLD
ncbi:MAG: outer membrane PBP1 activator LpoA protein [Gammaproteobacteria bacterium]|jgi:outer membrane PBP1 activator LpoA protein